MFMLQLYRGRFNSAAARDRGDCAMFKPTNPHNDYWVSFNWKPFNDFFIVRVSPNTEAESHFGAEIVPNLGV